MKTHNLTEAELQSLVEQTWKACAERIASQARGLAEVTPANVSGRSALTSFATAIEFSARREME